MTVWGKGVTAMKVLVIGGVAAGTGNSIPSYVPLENYLNMIEIVREYRGDFFNP